LKFKALFATVRNTYEFGQDKRVVAKVLLSPFVSISSILKCYSLQLCKCNIPMHMSQQLAATRQGVFVGQRTHREDKSRA